MIELERAKETLKNIRAWDISYQHDQNYADAIDTALCSIGAWQSVREQLIDELTGLDMFLEKEATIKWVLELIDRTLGEGAEDDSEL